MITNLFDNKEKNNKINNIKKIKLVLNNTISNYDKIIKDNDYNKFVSFYVRNIIIFRDNIFEL